MRHIESTLNKKQIFLSRILTSAAVLLWGVLLLLAAAGVLGADFKRLILPLFLSVAAVLFLALALLQQNTLLLWLFPCALILGVACFLKVYQVAGFGRLYPLFIAAPALASLVCGLYSGLWKDHIKVLILCAPASLIFCLNVFFDCGIGMTVAAFTVFLGAEALVYTVFNRNKIKEKSGETNEQN